MPLFTTDGLAITIGRQQVCRSLTVAIGAGERWGLLGRNGAGKTTLLHTLAGLRPADSGELSLLGQPLQSLKPQQIARHLGLLFQQQDDTFPSSVLEAALIGRHPYLKAWQWESQQDQALAVEALKLLGLEGLKERSTTTLSGGERQRLAIATLLTQSPDVMLLDEPSNHLDIHHQITVLDLLRDWSQQEQRALLMTLHDINLALRYCSHAVLLLGDGEVIQGGCDEVLTAENLERLYLHPLRKIEGEWGVAYLPK